MLPTLLLLSGLLHLLPQLPPRAPSPGPPCQAQLQLSHDAQLLTLTGTCRSLRPETTRYHYRLDVWRRGSAGQSQNTQAGEFALPAQQAVTLSTLRLSLGAADSYRARLLVLDAEGRTVAQDSASQH